MSMIPFTKTTFVGQELKFLEKAIKKGKLSGDSFYSHLCQEWFESQLNCKKTLMTPSCTAALEMAAILLDIKKGDEIILPSYTFVSTANAFALRGAKLVFIDIRPDTMNIDENLIENAITDKTKAIVVVHYAGISCEMNKIMDIANRRNIFVIEDAAQGIMCSYENKPLGTFGHLAALSFHDTKNISSGGEGGLLIINDQSFIERAQIIREKGTNRSKFIQGMVDKYTWVDIGSSYLPSELQSAYLWAQLLKAEKIIDSRLMAWTLYDNALKQIKDELNFITPTVPESCIHNGHMYYIKLHDSSFRKDFIDDLAAQGVMSTFHYNPLHLSPAGKRFGIFFGKDIYTTEESEKIVRLPMYYKMKKEDIYKVIKATRTALSKFI